MEFAAKLQRATILNRPNRFLMNIQLLRDGSEHIAHCPSTGRIGDLCFSDQLECLVSEAANDVKRKTRFTVEAISLNRPKSLPENEWASYLEDGDCWIGINQSKANSYVKHLLQNGKLSEMISGETRSEVTVGKSRLDFKIGDSFLEVKMPLTSMHVPDYLKKLKPAMRNKESHARMIKHFGELANSLSNETVGVEEVDLTSSLSSTTTIINSTNTVLVSTIGKTVMETVEMTDLQPLTVVPKKKAIIALVFMYDAPPFVPPVFSKAVNKIYAAAEAAEAAGVQRWQINLKITESGVSLREYFRLV